MTWLLTACQCLVCPQAILRVQQQMEEVYQKSKQELQQIAAQALIAQAGAQANAKDIQVMSGQNASLMGKRKAVEMHDDSMPPAPIPILQGSQMDKQQQQSIGQSQVLHLGHSSGNAPQLFMLPVNNGGNNQADTARSQAQQIQVQQSQQLQQQQQRSQQISTLSNLSWMPQLQQMQVQRMSEDSTSQPMQVSFVVIQGH